MLEPIQSGSHAVTSTQALHGLLTVRNIITLEISDEAILEFAMITRVITQNRDSLVTLTLNGGSREFTVSSEASEALAGAIQSCQNLRSLTIEHFFNSFRQHIKHFCLCLKDLPGLNELNFQNTFLGEYATDLLKIIETHTNLREVNLRNTALIYSANWYQVTTTLRNNSSLEVLDLIGNATRLLAVRSVIDGITSASNKIRSLKWCFLELAEGETLHWESDKRVNWQEDKARDAQLVSLLKRVETYRRTGEHLLISDYRIAKDSFAELMVLIAERNDPTSKTELTISISNEYNFNLALLTARIARHTKSLRELNIIVGSIENDNPRFCNQDFTKFINTIRSCTQLCELKLEHLQGTFKGESMAALLRAVASLPRLQVLSLDKTYVGPAGMNVLAELMRKNIITRLVLSLSGFVNNYCFEVLATAIQSNTSLETLILGKSPMTAMWVQILTQGVRTRNSNTPLLLVWTASEKDTMESQMLAMCDDLIDPNEKGHLEWRRRTLELYWVQRRVDLTPNWLELQRFIKTTTYQQLSGVLPREDPKKEQDVAIEMKPVATPSSHLLTRPKASYGTAASVSTPSKDKKSGLSL